MSKHAEVTTFPCALAAGMGSIAVTAGPVVWAATIYSKAVCSFEPDAADKSRRASWSARTEPSGCTDTARFP
jgi:hypothetical protein